MVFSQPIVMSILTCCYPNLLSIIYLQNSRVTQCHTALDTFNTFLSIQLILFTHVNIGDYGIALDKVIEGI